MTAIAWMDGSWSAGLIAAATLAIASAFDVRSRRIPNWLSAGGLVAGLAIAHTQNALYSAVAAALLAMLVMGFPNLFGAGAVGAGDVKLAGAMGALLGAASALLVIGIAACGVAAYSFPLRRLRKSWDCHIPAPFAPFLLAGFLIFELVCKWSY